MDAPTVAQLTHVAQTVLPWLTGGLAGALVGFGLNRRVARRTEPKLGLQTSVIPFSVVGEASLRDKLRVSYDGNHYENLALCECVITNPSERTVDDVTVVFEFHSEAKLINEPIIERTPVPMPNVQDRLDLPPHMLRYSFGTVDRGARIRFRVLLDGAPLFQAHVRAKGDPQIVEAGVAGADEHPEGLVAAVAYFFSMFVLAGAIPILGGAAQAGLILLAVPTLRRVVRHMGARPRSAVSDRAVSVFVDKMHVSEAGIGISLPHEKVDGRLDVKTRRTEKARA